MRGVVFTGGRELDLIFVGELLQDLAGLRIGDLGHGVPGAGIDLQ